MRLLKVSFFLEIFLLSCNDGTSEKFLKSAIDVAEQYAVNQLTVKEKKITKDGITVIGSEEKKYVIDPSKVFTGNINDDDEPDAVVTIVSFLQNRLLLTEHLIMLNEGGELIIIRSVESDMRILGLNNRIITAKVPTHPRSSPLHYCEECQEIRNYRYADGDLKEIK